MNVMRICVMKNQPLLLSSMAGVLVVLAGQDSVRKLAMKRKTFLLGWPLLATPAAVQAQFTYTVNYQTVTITGYTGGRVVSIPSTINGLPVASIGPDAFYKSSITGVTIPNGVTNIGVAAFQDCTSLSTVTIPDSVTNIGRDAFLGCVSLTNIM